MNVINMAGITHINTVGSIKAIERSAAVLPTTGNKSPGNFNVIHRFADANSSKLIVQMPSTENMAAVPQRTESGRSSWRPKVMANRKTSANAMRLLAVAQGSDSAPLAKVNWGEGMSCKVFVTAFPCNRCVAGGFSLRVPQS